MKITAVVTTCQRLESLRTMMATFQRHCLDASLIDEWYFLDDHSSEADIGIMQLLYPDVGIDRNPGKGHRDSINHFWREDRDSDFVLWLEDDWEFVQSGNMITDALSVMMSGREIMSVGLRAFHCPVKSTDQGVVYQLHEYTWRPGAARLPIDYDNHWPGYTLSPSLQDARVMRAFQPFTIWQEEGKSFEYGFALKVWGAGYRVAHLNVNYARHMGGPSAYDLNNSLRSG
jgi:hypothetical protein